MDLDKLIESVHPKNDKERNKIHKALSKVKIYDLDDHRIITVPKYLMGVIHQEDWYCANTLHNCVLVKSFDKGLKEECACVRDCYGRHWYYMFYDDTVYDDVHHVFIGVSSPDEAEALYNKIGLDTQAYFHFVTDEWRYPFFKLNTSDYLVYGTDDKTTTKEEYMEQLLINNDLLL